MTLLKTSIAILSVFAMVVYGYADLELFTDKNLESYSENEPDGSITGTTHNEQINQEVPYSPNSLNSVLPNTKANIISENKSSIAEYPTQNKTENSEQTETITNDLNNKTIEYKPIFGNELSRNTSKAYIRLVDLKGADLEPNILKKITLYRNYRNDLQVEEKANYNDETKTVECFGHTKNGIAAGDYELEIDGGGYGVLKVDFKIIKGQDYFATYKMPNYIKLIKFIFEDKNGVRQKYIRNIPIYTLEEKQNDFGEERFLRITKLVAKPSFEMREFFNYRRYGFSKRYKREFGIGITDNGTILIRVFANIEGKITYNIGDRMNPNIVFEIKNNFIDADEYLIQISPIDLDADTLSCTNQLYGYMPRQNIKYEAKPFNSLEPGFSIQVKESNAELALQYRFCDEKPELNTTNFVTLMTSFKNEFNQNIFNLQTENKMYFRFTDNKLYLSEWHEVILNDISPVYQDLKFNLTPFSLQIESSPTFSAMCRNNIKIITEGINCKAEIVDDKIKIDSYFSIDEIQNQIFEKLKIEMKSKIHILEKSPYKKQLHFFYPNKHTDLSDETGFSFKLTTHENKIKKTDNETIHSSIDKKIIILKTIDQLGNPIPYTECSLISTKNLNIALKVKNSLQNHEAARVANENLKIILNEEYALFEEKSLTGSIEYINEEETNKESNMVHQEEAAEKAKQELNKIFGNKECTDYFIEFGVWYDTANKSISDEDGFLILQADEIVPGEQYTLFFWCDSTDELKPDKEITFTASKAITDLGLIQF